MFVDNDHFPTEKENLNVKADPVFLPYTFLHQRSLFKI